MSIVEVGLSVVEPGLHTRAETDGDVASAPVWNCVVWDDPVNLMSYVTFVFTTYFGYSESTAHTLMTKVHNEGKAIVSSGTREKIEADVQAMHTYGLWATMEQAGA